MSESLGGATEDARLSRQRSVGAMRPWTSVSTVGDLLVRAAERDPDGDCLVFPDRRASFGSLLAAAERVARSLVAVGVGRGDHVGVLLPNCMEYAEVMLGTLLLGAWSVPINARYKARELAYVIENADLSVVVTTGAVRDGADFAGLVAEALPDLAAAADPPTCTWPGHPSCGRSCSSATALHPGTLPKDVFDARATTVMPAEVELRRSQVAVRDVAIMMYTSGTTAMPKGCPLSHEALVRTSSEAGRTRFELTATDRMRDPLPMFHMSFVLPFLACLDAGSRCAAWSTSSPAPPCSSWRTRR